MFMEVFGVPIETAYLALLIMAGCLTVLYLLFNDLLGGIADAIHFIHPALILAFFTFFSAGGYILEKVTPLSHLLIILKIAEFRREQDIARAKADQAYDLETARSKQDVTAQEMEIKIIERQKQIELEEKEILRRERQYDSEVKKKADADRYSVEQAAVAEKTKQMAEADAHKYRVEAMAKAEGERVRIDGTAKADAQRAQGESEAEVIRLKGLAEAETKRKIAEAYEQFGQAAVLDMILKVLPEYAKQVAAPLSNIDQITVVDTGSGANGGANKITGYATDLMSTLQETLKASSGIDVREMLEGLSGIKLQQTAEPEPAALEQSTKG